MTEPCPSTFFKTPCTLTRRHTGDHANLDPGYEIVWTDQAADQTKATP